MFSNGSQRRAPISKWVKKDIEYPFEHGAFVNYTLDSLSIHPVTTKIQTPFPNSVAGDEGNHSGISP
jgi:hypothetical protein